MNAFGIEIIEDPDMQKDTCALVSSLSGGEFEVVIRRPNGTLEKYHVTLPPVFQSQNGHKERGCV